ncbi:uncharacterized protein LOC110738014 [Chenopodium quinoa]|uniref:uncharacterized protein LOC110738014 n=1 Tax=Chenopodium quinoa TaxID=63459 RepID=UPI000B77A988|nr:uncharacterized protein LOC110738014 [Chenopodium quinoa]
MSPFLFAIGMEYLSRCLCELGRVPDFNYHPRCERLAITHLMFADDLLMFSRADNCSVKLLFCAFQKFSQASGLVANLSKSEVYFGGITQAEQDTLLSELGMATGTIPFKYLGVPLSSKKLTIQQCKPLVNKITSRIKSWAVRFISYAGRLQLIKSVLFGIQTYWAQIFVLPKKIIKEIESRRMKVCSTYSFCVAIQAGSGQRNNVLFNGCCEPADAVFKQVVYKVACRCKDEDRKRLCWV